MREHVDAANHGIVLETHAFLDIKNTLISAREIKRTFERLDETFPNLTEITERIPLPHGLIDTITRVITERGEVHDNASPRLNEIRRELRVVHDRLIERMQRMLSDAKVAP